MTTMVFSLPGHEALGDRLAASLSAEQGTLTLREFPDGETYVRGDTPCDGLDTVIAANLFRPNSQLLPLMYSVRAMRVLGARRVVLVTPYLPYMRQDARFQPGEVVTSRVFAKLLSETVDGMVTVDPHLHRYSTLGEIYRIPTHVGHAAPSVAAWIKEHIERPVVIGPDSESEQWVSEVAGMADAPFIVLQKTRRGDRDVEIHVPPLDTWRGFTPVLVDDIISTARTMMGTIQHLQLAGYPAAVCVGVHAVFAGEAYDELKAAGSADIVTCNTVEHASNGIDLTNVLTSGVQDLLSTSVSNSDVWEEPL